MDMESKKRGKREKRKIANVREGRKNKIERKGESK